MIKIDGLSKKYNDLLVLDNISLNIDKGKIYGLIGRSGAGKSTLLRCINGLEKYDSGSLKVDGVEINNFSDEELRFFRKEVGMIFQQFSLLSRMNVYDNIAFPLKCWKYDNNFIDKKVKELLEVVGIPDKLNSKPKELSGGQKQRVAIARALTMNPKILLCDEATSALDPKTAKSIIQLLQEINANLNITIVLVTHQMSVLKSACDEISILENGKISASGKSEKVFIDRPEALNNLIGNKDIFFPDTGVNIQIVLSDNDSANPVITKIARETESDFSILGGDFEKFRNHEIVSFFINIKADDFDKISKYLNAHNIYWKQLKNLN